MVAEQDMTAASARLAVTTRRNNTTMSRYSPAEQVKQQYLEAMGPELGPLFYRFWNECAWLHFKWGEFRILFGTKPERVKILNAAAGKFFRIVQDALLENVLLHIARLVDAPETGRKWNLTLQRLPGLVAPAIKAQTQELLDRCVEESAFAVDRRNRYIAHRDYHLALGKGAEPLASASRASVQEAIDAIVALLNSLELHYRKSTVDYGALIGDAESLLYVLKDGLEAEDRRRQRLQSGKLAPEDINPPRPV
jgi:hypothetical protein